MGDHFENLEKKIGGVVEKRKENGGEVADEALNKEIDDLRKGIKKFLSEAKDENDKKLREDSLILAVQKIAEKSSVSLFEIADLLFPEKEDFFLMPIEAVEFGNDMFFEHFRLLTEAEKDPVSVLEYSYLYKDQPYAAEVIEKAERAVLEKDPWVALAYAEGYKDQPYAAEVVEKAARTASEKEPWVALKYADRYKDQPYAAKVIRAAAEKDPDAALACADQYKDQPYAAKVIRAAAEKDPWSALKYADLVTSILGEGAKTLIKGCDAKIKIAERGYEVPGRTVQKNDFPIDKEKFKLLLIGIEHISNYQLITIPYDKFLEIFFSRSFQNFLQDKAGRISYMNAFSIAQSAYRLIAREGRMPGDTEIEKAVNHIWDEHERVKTRELFGPNTKLILFTHEGERFSNEDDLEKIYYRSGGKKENILADAKGVKISPDGKNIMKEKVLAAIRKAKTGPVTVLFDGHGSPENWAFAANTTDALNHELDTQPYSINYRELGDALIASGNIGNFNIIGSTCFAYDYLLNLFGYLESKGVKQKPFVSVSAANKAQYGWGRGKVLDSKLLEAMYHSSEDGKPITVQDFYESEGKLWRDEDPALFIGAGGRLPRNGAAPKSPGEDLKPAKKKIPQTGETQGLIENKPAEQPFKHPENFLEISSTTEGAHDEYSV